MLYAQYKWQQKGDYAMFIQVKAFNLFNAVAGRKPSIDRLNLTKYNRKGKYYVGASESGRFLQVNDGYHIRYYGNPFWNLYRIVSKNGNDYVIHEAK